MTEGGEGRRRAGPRPGDRVGGYELLSVLGEGAQASVFEAVRTHDGLRAALKVLAPERRAQPRLAARFRREAELARTVRHPNLVGFIELVEPDTPPGALAYAMELVGGRSLRARLEQGAVSTVEEAVAIGLGLARGLQALHGAGVVHRDLKPENVLIEEVGEDLAARVKILDYGVASGGAGAEPEDAEPAAGWVGTPRYMAPEQAAGFAVDARADLFALGVILFEMLSGEHPHEGDTLAAIIRAKLEAAPKVTIGHAREVLPVALTELVDACLERRPEGRPEDAGHALRVLEECRLVLGAVGRIQLDTWKRTVPVGVPLRSAGAAGRVAEAGTPAAPEPRPGGRPEPKLAPAAPRTRDRRRRVIGVALLVIGLVLGLAWVVRLLR